MTVATSPNGPYVLQANTHNSQVLRQLLASQCPVAGIINDGDYLVAAHGTPNMSVDVASGFAVCPGTQASPAQGSYHVYNDATVNLAVAASDPTNPRWDLVALSVRDSSYSGGNNDAILQVVTGTPAGSPSLPATPANSIALAKIVVGATVTTIVAGNLTDLRPISTWLQAPLGRLKEAQQTSAQTGIGTTNTDLTSLTVTPTFGARRKIKIEGYVGLQKQTTADVMIVYLMEGATQLQEWIVHELAGAEFQTADFVYTVNSPTSGPHTYKIQGKVGSGTMDTVSSTTFPGELIVTDEGHA